MIPYSQFNHVMFSYPIFVELRHHIWKSSDSLKPCYPSHKIFPQTDLTELPSVRAPWNRIISHTSSIFSGFWRGLIQSSSCAVWIIQHTHSTDSNGLTLPWTHRVFHWRGSSGLDSSGGVHLYRPGVGSLLEGASQLMNRHTRTHTLRVSRIRGLCHTAAYINTHLANILCVQLSYTEET